ncbi:hypothetical protein GCM10023149_07830 [Mucilaginibacter gynuensis]|uniref:DUF4397 domain-containing protein n=1 Tax=Mucilaginibacter gynuensis TaxID=1302236 RepID=A0ABP8FWL3_9SPHI
MKKIALQYPKIKYPMLLWLMAITACFTACRKEKADVRKDNRANTATRPLSTSRIINLAGYNQVAANGNTLTDPVVRDPNEVGGDRSTGTDFFPKNGYLEKSWQIPQELFGKTEGLEFKFGYIGPSSFGPREFTMPAIRETYNKPMDYYLLPTQMANGLPNYVRVERSVVQPSKADHFKIRIINLTSPITTAVASPRGPIESLVGPVTLTYADGTPVSAQTSNITNEQQTSDYVELPYGSYQFKVLTANGRQVPGASPTDGTFGVIDPPTSTVGISLNGTVTSAKLTFAPMMSYQPGGVYTIVVTPCNFNYLQNSILQASGAFQNAFHIVTDVSAPANTTYCRVQGVNALPGNDQVGFKINGQPLSAGLGYGEASAYSSYIQGDYTIDAVNAAGNVLASISQTFRNNQNYTLWLYPDAAGKAQILFVPNNLSGMVSVGGTPQDGSQGIVTTNYAFNKRFLNFSPDNPYITFTYDNGRPVSANMQPGVLKIGEPYNNEILLFYRAYEVMAYRSAPDVVPGTWARDIEVLKSVSFVANPALYTTPGRDIPIQEPGIYTVALIGRSGAGVPDAEKAKLIIVKHNK